MHIELVKLINLRFGKSQPFHDFVMKDTPLRLCVQWDEDAERYSLLALLKEMLHPFPCPDDLKKCETLCDFESVIYTLSLELRNNIEKGDRFDDVVWYYFARVGRVVPDPRPSLDFGTCFMLVAPLCPATASPDLPPYVHVQGFGWRRRYTGARERFYDYVMEVIRRFYELAFHCVSKIKNLGTYPFVDGKFSGHSHEFMDQCVRNMRFVLCEICDKFNTLFCRFDEVCMTISEWIGLSDVLIKDDGGDKWILSEYNLFERVWWKWVDRMFRRLQCPPILLKPSCSEIMMADSGFCADMYKDFVLSIEQQVVKTRSFVIFWERLDAVPGGMTKLTDLPFENPSAKSIVQDGMIDKV